jgi:multicomponent Na+:H+ antiporter subunit E
VTRLAVGSDTRRAATVRAVATGAVAYAFYLALGDPTDPFDLATGAASAVVVAWVLSDVAFERAPSRETLRAVVRAAVFLPLLLVAVVRANLSLAAVVLDPRLPIEPSLVRIPRPAGAVGTALLANAITLTPGTLTVDVEDDHLLVHALTAETRAELIGWPVVRAAAFVTGADPVVTDDPSAASAGDADR